MKKVLMMLSVVIFAYSCTQSDKKQDNQAAFDEAAQSNFDFKLVGIEKEENTKLVSKIEIAKKGTSNVYQVLEGFEADVQVNEDVILEDLNFDGVPDIRLMQYLPTDESIAYFYWLYDTAQEKYVRNQKLETQVFSPSVDLENQLLVSQWRKIDGSFGADFYSFTSASEAKLIKQEINTPYQDSLYKKVVTESKSNVLKTVSENIYKPNNQLPF